MKFKEKIKNKINNFKANTARFEVLSLDEWLNSQGLQENAKNRALYVQYRLNIDEKNKQQDKKLSKFIGTALFLVVFLVIFAIMCANSINASSVAFQTEILTESHPTSVYAGEIISSEITISTLTTFVIDIGDDYAYSYIIDNPVVLANDIVSYASGQLIDQDLCFEYFSLCYFSYEADVIDIGLDESDRAFLVFATCAEYVDELQNIYDDGFTDGYDEGKSDGYDIGYSKGESDGLITGETLKKSIFTIFDAPVMMLQQILNFEIMGINLYSIFTFIVTLCLLGILTKSVLSFFN